MHRRPSTKWQESYPLKNKKMGTMMTQMLACWFQATARCTIKYSQRYPLCFRIKTDWNTNNGARGFQSMLRILATGHVCACAGETSYERSWCHASWSRSTIFGSLPFLLVFYAYAPLFPPSLAPLLSASLVPADRWLSAGVRSDVGPWWAGLRRC